MHRNRKLVFVLGFVLVAATIASALAYHLIRRPARAVLLVPDGNLLVYVNFMPMHFADMGPMPFASNPQYQDFLAQTGFHFETDLDSLVLSASSPAETSADMTGILTGKFDQDRLTAFLQKQPVETESYGGKTIFSLREGTQALRVCILDGKTVALAGGDSPESMHGIIDRATGAASSHWLLDNYYGEVPFGSVAWAIARVPGGQDVTPVAARAMNLDFLRDSVTVVSLRYSGSLRFRAEFISSTKNGADQVFHAINGALELARAGQGMRNQDKDLATVIEGTQLQQSGNRIVLSIVVPQDVITRMSKRR
jgi:hypothetical protein